MPVRDNKKAPVPMKRVYVPQNPSKILLILQFPCPVHILLFYVTFQLYIGDVRRRQGKTFSYLYKLRLYMKKIQLFSIFSKTLFFQRALSVARRTLNFILYQNVN